MNERWRVALAGLVAAVAIPFLVIDSPGTAEGVETEGASEETVDNAVAAPEPEIDESEESDAPRAVEFVVLTEEVEPNVAQLAAQASAWATARQQAVDDGLVTTSTLDAPSNTDLSLLPTVRQPAPEPAEPEPAPEDESPSEPVVEAEETPQVDEPEVDEPEAETEPVEPSPEPAPAPEEPEAEPTAPETVLGPAAPPQVDGRVPPPAGGPTGSQWDELRRCESTHNYAAISPSGLYRGAYQFSQQTWDWVAGIHWPHLVGIDPINAQPAWQDVMAYTLFAMRGWDQWPICGRNLL